MMRKLRDLQSQLDERSDNLSRKEAKLRMLEAEKDTAIKRLRDAQGDCNNYDNYMKVVGDPSYCASCSHM